MPEGEIFSERRRFKRADKNIEVTYKIVSLPTEAEKIKQQAEKNTVESVNISIGGIQLIDDEELGREQILRIEFKVEGRQEPVVTFAEVKWSAKDNVLGRYRTGIEFLVLKDEDKAVIESII